MILELMFVRVVTGRGQERPLQRPGRGGDRKRDSSTERGLAEVGEEKRERQTETGTRRKEDNARSAPASQLQRLRCRRTWTPFPTQDHKNPPRDANCGLGFARRKSEPGTTRNERAVWNLAARHFISVTTSNSPALVHHYTAIPQAYVSIS